MTTSQELQYFFSHAPWPVINQGIKIITGLVISVSFARLANPELYGQYQYILAILSILSVLSLSGLNLSVMKSIVGGAENALRRGVRLSFMTSFLGIPILLSIAAWQYFHAQPVIGRAIIIGAILFPVLYSTNTWSSFYNAKKRFRDTAIRTSILNICLTTGLWLSIYYKASLPILIAVFGGIQGIFHFFYYLTTIKLITTVNQSLNVKHGLKITAQKFAQTLTASIPPLAIAWFYNFEQIAIYSVFFSLFHWPAASQSP